MQPPSPPSHVVNFRYPDGTKPPCRIVVIDSYPNGHCMKPLRRRLELVVVRPPTTRAHRVGPCNERREDRLLETLAASRRREFIRYRRTPYSRGAMAA